MNYEINGQEEVKDKYNKKICAVLFLVMRINSVGMKVHMIR